MLKHHWDELLEKLIGLIPVPEDSSWRLKKKKNPLFPNTDPTLYLFGKSQQNVGNRSIERIS